jgi:ubiquinone biosynthesis protein
MMRRFLVRILFYSVAVGATLALLSIVTIPTAEHPEGVPLLTIADPDDPPVELDISLGPLKLNLVVGFAFVVGAAVLPVILAAIFGRWYLKAPALSFLGVSALVFWLVAQVCSFFGFTFQVPDPALLWLFIDSIVFGLVFLALDTVFGLQRPHMSDTAAHRSLWSRLDRLPISRRNQLVENIRMYEVYTTVTAYAQEIAVAGTPLSRFRGLVDRLSGTSSASLDKLSTAAKVRVMLQQLGPTYVKLGQMVGGRRELLPPGWSEEFAKLQSTVPPFPWSVAKSVITQELGRPPDELFGSIEEEPLGAASLAQVHSATLKDGRQVVVKIQRPDIQAMVRADLGVMQQLAAFAEQRSAAARRFGLAEVIEEFADGVMEELDYTTEAYNARRLADVVASIDGVGVPDVYPDLSTRRVLVMDFVQGVKATHADELDPSVDREAVARTLIAALIKQLLIDGFFHADPHPGNVMLDQATGRVMFLDLGLMGELRQQQRLDLIALVWALKMEDPGMLAVAVRRLCRATGTVDDVAFRAAIERILYRSWVYGKGSFSGVMASLFTVLGDQHLQMRRELVLAIKAITQAEQLVSAIQPGLPLVEVIAEEAQGLIRAQLGGQLAKVRRGEIADVLMGVVGQASTLGDAFLPHLVEAIVSGSPIVGGGTGASPDLAPLERRVERLSERLDRQLGRLATGSALVGVAIIAAALVLAILPRPTDVLVGFDLVALLFAVGVAAFLVIAVRDWRRDDATWLTAIRHDPEP